MFALVPGVQSASYADLRMFATMVTCINHTKVLVVLSLFFVIMSMIRHMTG